MMFVIVSSLVPRFCHCDRSEAISIRLGPLRCEIAAAPLAPRYDSDGSCGALKDRATVDHGQFDAALYRPAVERRVFRFRTEPVGLDTELRVGIEDHEIRRCARRH